MMGAAALVAVGAFAVHALAEGFENIVLSASKDVRKTQATIASRSSDDGTVNVAASFMSATLVAWKPRPTRKTLLTNLRFPEADESSVPPLLRRQRYTLPRSFARAQHQHRAEVQRSSLSALSPELPDCGGAIADICRNPKSP